MSWWYRIVRHSAWVLTRQSYTKPKRKPRLGSDTGGSRKELSWSGEWDESGFPDPIFTEEERVQREARREERRRQARKVRRRIVVGCVIIAVLYFLKFVIVG